MRSGSKFFVCLAFAGVFLAAGPLIGLVPSAHAEGKIGEDKFKPGDKAPEFEKGTFLDGSPAKLASLGGKKVLLLNFWGLRCGACLEEIPYLEVLAKKYGGKGVAVWGVNTDGADATTVRETLETLRITVSYPVVLDPEFSIADTYTNFLVPLTLVIDRGGVVRYIHTGFDAGTEKQYEAAVVKALER